MKNNLLSAAALAVVLAAGAAWMLSRPVSPTPEITLPEVEITAWANLPVIGLPEVTISAGQQNIPTLTLPEVTIRAKKRLRV